MDHQFIDKIKETEKLLETGWQSWSTGKKRRFKLFINRHFPPEKDATVILPTEVNLDRKKIHGWCSWYAFFNKITDTKILTQAKFIAEHREEFPLECILIDDGWTLWGDWDRLDKKKFPHGLSSLSKKINNLGLKTGIWLAPFLVHPKSALFKTHPDWVVKKGRRHVEGLMFSYPFLDRFMPFKKYILDISNMEVIKFLNNSIDRLVEKGFTLFKLDFLYAPYFYTKRTPEETSQLLRSFLLGIKKRHSNVHIIGCGLPLVPAVGVVDSMRVGPDNITPNVDRIPLIGKIVNTYKLKKAIKTINRRKFTHNYWNIDPDAFICRKSLGISEKHIINLQKIIMETNGNIFLGDDLTKLPKERVEKFIKPLFK